MSLSHPLVRNVLGRYVYPAINTARNLFADTGRILTTLALFAKSITLGCGSNFLPYIVEEMKMKLNADDEKITKVFKIFAMMSLVGSLLGIFVFKKVRRQLGTMYILVGISVSMIMIPNCPGLDSFFIAVGIFGAFVGLIVPGQIVWTMEMWQKQSTPILQALMFFFSIGMSLPEYITAPFLTPVISNSTDVLDMMDVNETLSAPTNGTFGEFLRGIKHNFVAQTSGGQTQQFSNIHIPFAILGVMAFFNAWIERLLFKHYNYAPPPPPSPPQKQEEDKKGEDNRKGGDDKGDPSGKDFEQIKKYKPDEHFEEEDEEFLEEEYDQEEEVEEEEEEELRKDEDEEDEEEDEDDDEGMESETSPMLKNQNKSFLQEIKVEQVRPPESRSSATLPVQKMIPAGVLSSVALPESPNKPSEEKSSTLPTPKRLIPEDKSSTMPAESEARERRRQSSIRRDSQIASLGRKLSSSLTKSKGTRRSRSGSKRNRKSLKKGPKDAKDEKTKEEEKVEGKDVEDYVESPKESEWEETVDDEEYEETDADFCEQPLLPKGGSGKGDGGIDLFEINSEDDIDTRRASTASMLDDNREDESSDPETEEVSEFSDEEGVVMPPAPPTASSSKENMLSDGEVKSPVKGSGIKDKVVSLVDDKLKSSDKERSGKGKSEEAITSKPAVVKKDEKQDETDSTAKAPLGTTEKGQKLEEDKVKEKELQLEKDKAKEKEDKSKDKDQSVEKDKAKEVEGVEKKETGETPKDVPPKVAKKKEDGDEIKTAEKEDEQKMEMEQEAGDEGDGGNPVQKVINKIKSLKKIAVGVWNMLRDPVQRRGLYVIGLSSVFFGAYAAIEKCSKDLLPGLGQEGNLKLDEEGGALILKGFTMAFMVGRLAGMVISLKISPFLLLCSDLALVFLGNFMLIFGASFSEHIMLVGCVLLGLGLSTIYAGLFTFLCGLIPFTDVVGSVLIVLSSIATSVYADLIGDFISGNAQRLTSANYISGLTCTLAFKLIYSMTKPKKPSPPDLEQVVSAR